MDTNKLKELCVEVVKVYDKLIKDIIEYLSCVFDGEYFYVDKEDVHWLINFDEKKYEYKGISVLEIVKFMDRVKNTIGVL